LGFRPEWAKQGGLDLACLGRKVFPPEDMAAKLIFLGPFGEEKRPLFLERPSDWLGFASLFISAEMAYFSLFISAAYNMRRIVNYVGLLLVVLTAVITWLRF
jgi:hypothetical protein